MIEIARPALLWTGALAALLPLALHLLRPRERDRRLLPTARFLSRETRTRIRIHRFPDHLVLLLLRMAFCLILGAALAGMRWIGPSEGIGEIVIVDRGPGMAPVWSDAEAALAEMVGDRTRRIILVGLDEDGSVTSESIAPGDLPEGEAWATLAPVEQGPWTDVHLAHLLRELRTAGGGLAGVDSIEARILTRARWSAWHPGTLALRAEIWPAGIGIELVTDEGLGTVPGGPSASSIRLLAPEGVEAAFREALELWGYDPTRDEGPEIELMVGPPDGLGALWQEAEESSPREGDGTFLLPDGRVVPGAGRFLGGFPPDGARVPLFRGGGRPAAAATGPGPGEPCRIALPLDGVVPILGELVVLLDALLWEGCRVRRASAGEDESAAEFWRVLLETADGIGPVSAELIRTEEAGRPLARLLMALAFILALGELIRVRALP